MFEEAFLVVFRKIKVIDSKEIDDQMKERIAKIYSRQQESKDFDYPRDDNIEYDEVQSP